MPSADDLAYGTPPPMNSGGNPDLYGSNKPRGSPTNNNDDEARGGAGGGGRNRAVKGRGGGKLHANPPKLKGMKPWELAGSRSMPPPP